MNINKDSSLQLAFLSLREIREKGSETLVFFILLPYVDTPKNIRKFNKHLWKILCSYLHIEFDIPISVIN